MSPVHEQQRRLSGHGLDTRVECGMSKAPHRLPSRSGAPPPLHAALMPSVPVVASRGVRSTATSRIRDRQEAGAPVAENGEAPPARSRPTPSRPAPPPPPGASEHAPAAGNAGDLRQRVADHPEASRAARGLASRGEPHRAARLRVGERHHERRRVPEVPSARHVRVDDERLCARPQHRVVAVALAAGASTPSTASTTRPRAWESVRSRCQAAARRRTPVTASTIRASTLSPAKGRSKSRTVARRAASTNRSDVAAASRRRDQARRDGRGGRRVARLARGGLRPREPGIGRRGGPRPRQRERGGEVRGRPGPEPPPVRRRPAFEDEPREEARAASAATNGGTEGRGDRPWWTSEDQEPGHRVASEPPERRDRLEHRA